MKTGRPKRARRPAADAAQDREADRCDVGADQENREQGRRAAHQQREEDIEEAEVLNEELPENPENSENSETNNE